MASSVKDIHLIDVVASRPAASALNNGYYFTATDVDGGTTYRSNGSTWVAIAGGVTISGGSGALLAANNLSDVLSAATSRTNLGLGTAATHADTDYEHVANKAAASGYASLDSGGKVPSSQLPSSIAGGLTWKGTWNASTNSPTLASGTGTTGDTYKVSVAGSTSLDGITDWKVGDWAIFEGSVWQKIDQTESVTSVAGRTGAIVLVKADITDLGTIGTMAAETAADYLTKAGNLSGLASQSTARTNLGLGSAATQSSSAFDAAGAAAAVLGMPLALTGATSATRYVGATTSGAPASGTFAVGDFIVDRTGKIYVCTTAGSPGTWTVIGGGAGGTGIVNVKDYGAVGDGTTNDYSAINTAIATGLTVYFPPAIYAIGTGLVMNADKQQLIGYGATLKKTANIDAITMGHAYGQVGGFIIDGNSHTGAAVVITGNKNSGRDLLSLGNADGFVIYGPGTVPGADMNHYVNCMSYANTQTGFYLHNATDCSLIGCRSQTNGHEGLLADAQSYTLRIIGCFFDDNNTSSGGYHNIFLSQCDGGMMTNTTVTNCEHSGHGISFDSTAANQSGFGIVNCAIAQNGGYGIKIRAQSSHTSNKIRVVGCRLNGSASGSVQIDTGCTACRFIGNDFNGDSPSDSGTSSVFQGNDVGNSSGTLTVEEGDGSPTGAPTKIVFPNGTLSYVGTVVTYTPSGASLGFFQQNVPTPHWTVTVGTESSSASNTDQTKFNGNSANNVEWSMGINIPAGSYKLDIPLGLGAGFGIVRCLIGGVQVVSNDRYSAAADTYPLVTLDLGTLSAGHQILAITCTTKNGSATGKQLVLRAARLWQYA